MSYQVISRKWRPDRFEDVVGQEHITRVLQNALLQDRLGHAYIFSGPRGTGKTTTARLLAKRVNCLEPAGNDPCNRCVNCVETAEGRNMDVQEIDGASNRGIDDIRNLREVIKYPPTRGSYRIFIIDEFHQITKEGSNALLKTLEEPPPHALFIFATTELGKVLPTILSRCQRFEFHRISSARIVHRLRLICDEEKISIDDEALAYIARRGEGSMRDSQSYLEQVISLSDEHIDYDRAADLLGLVRDEYYIRTLKALKEKAVPDLMGIVDEVSLGGYEMTDFISGLASYVKDIYLLQNSSGEIQPDLSEDSLKKARELTAQFSGAQLVQILSLCHEHTTAMKNHSSPRLLTESFLLKLLYIDSIRDLDRVLKSESGPAKGSSAAVPVQNAVKAPVAGRTSEQAPAMRPPAAASPSVSAPKPPESTASPRTGKESRPAEQGVSRAGQGSSSAGQGSSSAGQGSSSAGQSGPSEKRDTGRRPTPFSGLRRPVQDPVPDSVQEPESQQAADETAGEEGEEEQLLSGSTAEETPDEAGAESEETSGSSADHSEGSDPDLELLNSLWNEVSGKAGERNHALYGILPQTRPHAIKKDGVLVLRYSSGLELDLLKRSKKDLEQALAEVSGRQFRLSFEKVKLTEDEKKRRKAMEIDEATQLLIQAFDGEII